MVAAAAAVEEEEDATAAAAEPVGAARVCATHSAQDIIHCLGGVHVLFPLLAPPSETAGLSSAATAAASALDADADASVAVDTMDLLAALLEGSRLNQEALRVSGGHSLIAHLLRRDGGSRLSPELLPATERLVRSVGRYGWSGPGGESEQAAVRLLLDLRLWGGPGVPEAACGSLQVFEATGATRSRRASLAVASTDARRRRRRAAAAGLGLDPRLRELVVARYLRCGALLPGAVPAAFGEMAAAAVFAVEEAGELSKDGHHDENAGAIAADILEALVEMLQPGYPRSDNSRPSRRSKAAPRWCSRRRDRTRRRGRWPSDFSPRCCRAPRRRPAAAVAALAAAEVESAAWEDQA